MKAITIVCLLLAATVSTALAKRSGPKPVEPVVHEGVKFVAANESGREGKIEAQDEKTGAKLWDAVIYTVKIDPSLEEDVQWVFITGMKIRDHSLIVTNEKNEQYILDLATRKVEKANAADPLAPWLNGVTFHLVSDQADRHNIHSYYVTSPESPDGKWVLFYTSTDPAAQEEGEIHIRDRATGTEKVLARHITAEDAHRVACQQWISGGRRVAYHDWRGGHWVVAVVDIASGEERVLAHDYQLGFGSPAGDTVPIYGPHSVLGEHRDVDLLNVETGKITTAVTARAAIEKYPDYFNKAFGDRPISLFFPVLSPDGKRLFFKLSTPGNGNFRSPKASQRQGLIGYDLEASRFLLLRPKWGHPAWASESRTVIEPGGIIVNTDDDSSIKVPGIPAFRGDHPSFSPDRRLVVTDTTLDVVGGDVTDWGIVLYRVSDGKLAIIHKADNSHGARSWRVSHPHPAFSPDGRRIYFNESSTGHTQLWVAEIGNPRSD